MSVRNTNAPKRSRLTAALITALVMPFAGSALAQEAGSTRQQPSTQSTSTLDKVTVTGSRIKKAEVEGPAPVVVLTAEDIEREGIKARIKDGVLRITLPKARKNLPREIPVENG